MCNENQQLKKNWKNQNCFKQQQQQRRNKQQQLIQLQKELLKYKQKKTKKQIKQKEQILNDIVKLNESDFAKLLKNNNTYHDVKKKDESENQSASASDSKEKPLPAKKAKNIQKSKKSVMEYINNFKKI